MLRFKKHKKSLSDHDLVALEENKDSQEFNMFGFRPVADFLKSFLKPELSKSNQSENISLSPKSEN